ncbi:unnamed protein product [Brachionus calyciflorus]|uniref:Uncharacterized protein n=1 Tax=Brachionus calyciflorus TaxID=104777 RepID=A0A813VRV0_9BILA|nr:unnamed protein product [Brachionus calyciflorus]
MSIVGILMIFIFCNGQRISSFWNQCFGKNKNLRSVDYSTNTQKSINWSSLSVKLKKNFRNIRDIIIKDKISYVFLAVITLFLTSIQVFFTNKKLNASFINKTRNLEIIKITCHKIEEYYMFEDLFYLPLSLLFLVILQIFSRTGRFNKYIMNRFKDFFQTDFFKNVQRTKKKEHEDRIKKKEEEMLKQKCGKCKYVSTKCCSHYFCTLFCCMFCCSCCVPPGSDTRCFLFYSLQLGWQQTTCKKICDIIKLIFKIILCVPLWKFLLNLTKEKKPENKNDEDDQIQYALDEDDFDLKEQRMYRNKAPCPFPSTPFSTSNRAQSAAVYVIYTYDVLNIFMYVYTLSLSPKLIPFIGNIGTPGIILDLLIQVIQVLLIGIKFYPILVVADSEPNFLIYLFSSTYMFIIWTGWLLKKAFCSRSEAFVRQLFKLISTEFGDKVKYSIGLRRNLTDQFMAFFTDQDNMSENYLNAIKVKIPMIFDQYFRKNENLDYDQNEPNDIIDPMNSINFGYYSTQPNVISTTYMTSSATTLFSFRNKTRSKFKQFENKTLGYFFQTGSFDLIEILETLPLYLTLSYLVARYFMLCLSTAYTSLSRRYSNFKRAKNYKSKNVLTLRSNILNEQDNQILNDLLRQDVLGKLLNENGKLSNYQNHNILYVKNLFNNTSLFQAFKNAQLKKAKSLIAQRFEVSFIWYLIENKIYQNIHYFRYSKQFVNTYTVAFMVVYFFTLFGLRISNFLGSSFIQAVEQFYKLFLRYFAPLIDVEKHNLNTEINLCIIFTSLLTAYQLFLSIKNFKRDVLRLHKGEKFFRSLVLKYKDENYEDFIKKRNNASATITNDSLHFPGYLIAHLVYGYLMLFLILLCVMIIFKFLYYVTNLQTSLQIFLPIVILFTLKFTFIKFIVRIVLLKTDKQRIVNLAPYFLLTYFNFFFDCFLGLVACASRVWQTTIVSIFFLPRLDKSIFNKENDLLIRRLDKGHLAYLNYVRMDHWYNNNIMNCFCEISIESIMFSEYYKEYFRIISYYNFKKVKMINGNVESGIGKRKLSIPNRYNKVFINQPKKSSNLRSVVSELVATDENPENKFHFKYESFLRLRNLIFLSLLLNKNPALRKYRYHYLNRVKQEEIDDPNYSNVETAEAFIKRWGKFKKKFEFLKK